jgi:DNA repair exonuclease SbcCD ATPase subunit
MHMAEKTASTRKRPPVRKEVADAIAEARPAADELREAQMTADQQARERAAAAAVATAEGMTVESVTQTVGELRVAIGKSLAELSDRLEGQVRTYRQLTDAIAAREKELAEIYEIERSAGTLLGIAQAQRQKQENFEAQMREEREAFESDMKAARDEWEAESEARAANIKAADEAEQQRQKRVRDEFNYTFAREQKTMRDALADERAKLERELEEKRRTVEGPLVERERAVAAKEMEYDLLSKRVEAFPAELQAAETKAVERETRQLRADAKNTEELLKRDFAAERNTLSTRVAGLEATLTERDARIEKLLQQVERAQAQVHETALRSIEGASSTRTLGELQQRLVDSARKTDSDKRST